MAALLALPPLAAPSSPTLQARPDDPWPALPLPPARIVAQITLDPDEQAELRAIEAATAAIAVRLMVVFLVTATLATAGVAIILARALAAALHGSIL